MNTRKLIDRTWAPMAVGDCVWFNNAPWELLSVYDVAEGPEQTVYVTGRNMEVDERFVTAWSAKVTKTTIQFHTIVKTPCDGCKNQLRCVLRGEPKLLESGIGLDGLDLATEIG